MGLIARWLRLERDPAQGSLFTAGEEHRGMLRVLSGNGTSTRDKLYLGRDSSGTKAWVEIVNDTDAQSLANKTLTSPAIADFTNAQHTHANASGGGTVSHAVLSNIGTNSHATIDAFMSDVKATTFITRTPSGVITSEFALNSLAAGVVTTDGSGNLSSSTSYAQDRRTGVFLPAWFQIADLATVAAPASNQANAIYLGVAPFALTSVKVLMNVTTGYVAGTWAELGIATGTLTLNAGASLTRRGFTNVATTFNATGMIATTITVSGINAGDDVWLLWGSQGGTAFQVRGGLGDQMSSGLTQFASATRISTMAAATAFTKSASATLACWAAIQWS